MDLEKYRNKMVGSEDERAVSPVIGVILMVAITVILAAVIAAFVLDIGDLDDSAPNAQFDWEVTDHPDEDEEVVAVTHTSGDDIEASDLDFDAGEIGLHSDSPNIDTSDDTWTAGDTVYYDDDGGEFEIVWNGDGSSTVLTSHEE